MSRLALLLVLLLPQAAAALTLTDQTGRQVVLPAPPDRIVSLVPSVTETVFAIGAQDRLVGVTDFCDYPAAARRKPSVGGMIAPSLEGIVGLRPDLVVATTAGNRHETFDQLGRLKIPVYLVNPTTVDDVLDLVSRLGRLTDRAEQAGRVEARLRERIQAISGRVLGRTRPRVLYVLWPDPLIVPARGALVSELIALAGGDSVTADGGHGYPRYSMEAALARSPEVILIASHDATRSPLVRSKWVRFAHVPAVSAGRLHTVDGNLMHRYGPRMVDGLETLARLIHPEAFVKVEGRR
ncbi:MAG TPA: cobalamin-binding protein [Methylomirabilota bacterium]|nr:cobalamin-binding protein [Methylomirabilota bacterium]